MLFQALGPRLVKAKRTNSSSKGPSGLGSAKKSSDPRADSFAAEGKSRSLRKTNERQLARRHRATSRARRPPY